MNTKKTNYELIVKAQNGDNEALMEVYEKNKPLVVALLNRYQYNATDKEDLLSVGMLGLLKAIKQFDVTYDVEFSTYAVPLILGEIKRYFRDDGALKVSRQFKELYIKITRAEREFEELYQKSASLEDLAAILNENKENILMAIESHYYPSYLSKPLDEDNLTLGDTLGEDDVIVALEKMDLYDALEKLDPKEKLLIKLRYFEGLKQNDVAERFFISQVQVSRLEKKILEKLKTMLVK